MKAQPKKPKETYISIVLEATFRIILKKKTETIQYPSRTERINVICQTVEYKIMEEKNRNKHESTITNMMFNEINHRKMQTE